MNANNHPASRFWLWLFLAAGLSTALGLYVHRLMTYGDNLDYLFIAWKTCSGDWLHPFHWRFPAGYPYLLAGWLWLTGQPTGGDLFLLTPATVHVAKVFSLIWLFPSLAVIWGWLRQVKSPALPYVALLLATSQSLMLRFSIIGSEPVFIFCSIAALWLWERACQTDRPARFIWIGAAGLTFAATQMRQIGLALPVAVLGYSLVSWRKHSSAWRRQVWIAALIPLILALLLLAATNPAHLLDVGRSSQPASRHFAILDNLAAGFSFYGMAMPDVVAGKVFGPTGILQCMGGSTLELPLVGAMYVILLAGILCIFRDPNRPGRLSVLYVAASIMILLVFPGREYRYWPPMLPILLFLIVSGIQQLLTCRTPRLGRYLPVLLLAWIGFQATTDAFATQKNMRFAWNLRDRPPWAPERYEPSGELDFAGILDAGEWLGSHSPANSVSVSSKALFVQISSRRPTKYPQQIDDAIRQSQTLNIPLYLVIDAFSDSAGYGRAKATYLLPLIQQNPGRFALVYESRYLQTRVYRCDPGTPLTAIPAGTASGTPRSP